MELQGINTSSMMIDPKSEDATKKFFNLLKRKQENYSVEVNSMVRYILLMYDPASPLLYLVDDYWARKYEALEASGFKQKKKKYSDSVEAMVLGSNEAVTDLIIDFLIEIAKPTWTHIVFLNESLIRFTKQTQSEEKVAQSDINAVSTIMEKLSKVIKEFTQSDSETKEFINRLYYKAHQELLKIRPEHYAKKTEVDEDCPYGDYKVEKLKLAKNGNDKKVR